MSSRSAVAASVLVFLVFGCVPQAPPPPEPVAKYSYIAATPCLTPGSTKLTLALVSPRWQDPSLPSAATIAAQPGSFGSTKVILDLSAAMRADFLQLVSCKGYLTKGPFDSFDSMVYPDRQASQLLLEPELLIDVEITKAIPEQPGFLAAVIAPQSQAAPVKVQISGTVGGRVNLNLKEPLTNTRMWSKSIELPSGAFSFETAETYPPGLRLSQYRLVMTNVNDAAFMNALIPRLEEMYGAVFKAADNYLNKDELTVVATQAADVRTKAGIKIPPR